jgi:hypothetical protein
MNDAPKVSLCPLCDADLVASKSAEHIILNAIGGRLTTHGFICDACNHRTGREWDAVAADQLNFWCLFFGIKRQRGRSPKELIETTAGERLLMQPGGGFELPKPIHNRRQTDAGLEIAVTARSMDEARSMLQGLKRKYPSVDVEATMRTAKENYSYPKGVVRRDVGFGGKCSGRSVVKSALALAHRSGITVRDCRDALAYLRDPNGPPCFGYYYERDLLSVRPDGIPLHCVAISANPDSGLLLGYVEYFGLHRMVVSLSKVYRGSRIEAAYCLNPLTGELLPITVALPFSESDIEAIFNYERIPDGSMQQAADKVISAGMRRQFERERARVTRDAAEYALANSGAKWGEALTPEQMAKLPELIMQRLAPFIQRHLVRQPPALPRASGERLQPTGTDGERPED